MKRNYLSPQIKVLTMYMRQEVLTASYSDAVPVIGSEDLGIHFDEPTPAAPEDAF